MEYCLFVKHNRTTANKMLKYFEILLLFMGMNFVCRLITVEDILKCSFGLNKTELAVMKHLLEEKEEFTIEEIQNRIKKDRTTIQRAVKDLFEKNLIKRRQINLKNGGYQFVYSPKAKKELKEKVYEIFENFKETMGNEIQKW